MGDTHGLVLHLFVTGHTIRSERAIRAVRQVCGPAGDLYHLTVVDVLEQPELAEAHRVIATPTLIRHTPEPIKRIIGDLSDLEALALALDLAWEPS